MYTLDGDSSMFMWVYRNACVCMLRLDVETRFSLMTVHSLFQDRSLTEPRAHWLVELAWQCNRYEHGFYMSSSSELRSSWLHGSHCWTGPQICLLCGNKLVLKERSINQFFCEFPPVRICLYSKQRQLLQLFTDCSPFFFPQVHSRNTFESCWDLFCACVEGMSIHRTA